MDKQGEIQNENENEIIKKRTEKIITWFKNPYNLAFFSIILFAIIIRLYYFFIVSSQPIWWDEAEYLNMAKAWSSGAEYLKYDSVRPILFSLIMALFFKISSTEFLPRFFLLTLSIISVVGVYYLAKELYDKRVGLLSCFFASVFYLNLFYTYRLQVDIPSTAFVIFAILFFYRYSKYNLNKDLYLGAALLAIGTLFKQSTAFILLAFFLYFFTIDKFNLLKKKEMWIAASIFVLIELPYIIWGYIKFGGFIFTEAAGKVATDNYLISGYNVAKNYILLFPNYFSWPLLIIFILGLVLICKIFVGFDILIKNENKKLNKDWFVFLILVIPFLLTSILITHNEDRYLMHIFPIIFIISSMLIMIIYDFIKKYSKTFAIILLICLLVFNGFFQIASTGYADDLIKSKKYSYLEIKNAGEWFKEYTQPNEEIISQSLHQIEYYSERNTIAFPDTEEEFEILRQKNKNLKYYMLSVIQNSPPWSYAYPQNKNLTIINGYFTDQTQQQPVILIYILY